MTTRTDGHQDQASSETSAAGGGATDGASPDQSASSAPPSPIEPGEPERRRSRDGLAIGAPLTAAFIGGFLVIENLADADQPEEGAGVNAPEQALLLEGEAADGADDLSAQSRAAGTSPKSGDAGQRAEDVAAAPSEDGAIAIDAEGVGAVQASPVAAATASGAPAPDGPEGGGEANLNFFNINVGGAEAEAGVEPIIEDDILRRDQQFGTPGDDVLVGTDGDDAISGGSGDDILRGQGGSDLLNGNEGHDQLFGGAGEDDLKGGAGNDFLDGGDDYDNLLGGSGDDVLVVNGRHDVALDYDSPANSGDDLLIVRQGYADDIANSGIESATFTFSENLGAALPDGSASYRQQVANGIEHVTLEGNANLDIFADSDDNRLTGNDGANLIHGGRGDDQVTGGGGRDVLRGGEGDDEISGGDGDDVIEGGLGEDMLYGEAGDDVFVIGLNDNAVDTVFDHEGANRLTLEGVTDQTVEASLLGDDLYVTVDQSPVAVVSGYVGHEDALAGIDFGQGLRTVETLLTNRPDLEATVDETEAQAAEAAADDLLAAHLHLTEPTVVGDPRTNQRLDGADGDDWLSGYDGKDILFGKDGNDILEGGDGVDRLVGGAGDDRYLFSKGERGIDKIDDAEGRNLAELKGYDRAEIDGAMLGDDLAVLADGEILFTVDDFAANQGAFHGVQAGNRFIPTEDLLA